MVDDPLDILDSTNDCLTGTPRFCFGEPGETFVHHRLNNSTVSFKLPQINITKLMAHYVWRSSVLLAHMIDLGIVNVAGKDVIELGAGVGIPSFVASMNGASIVHITDYPDESILSNIRLNHKRLQRDKELSTICVYGHKWGDAIDRLEKFDIILLADVFWLDELHADLLKSINRLLKRNGRVYLTSCNHVATSLDSDTNETPATIDEDMDLTASTRAFLCLALNAGFIAERCSNGLVRSIPESFKVVFYTLYKK